MTDHHADHHADHHHKLRFLLHSAAALASTTVITAALGFVYWAVAARVFPATDIGESSTAIAAMSLIAPLTLLGFGTLLLAQLPTMKGGRSTLVATVALLTGLVSGGIAMLCSRVLPSDFLGLPGIGTNLSVELLFAAAVATQCVGLLLDQSLLSMIGGGMQLRRNLIQAVVKLVLLVVFAATISGFGSRAILMSWMLANVVSLVVVGVGLMRRHMISFRQLIPAPRMLHGLHFDAARHHVLNTALLVPYFAMPIVANVTVGSEQAAYFYAALSLSGAVFFLPLSLSTALFASGARDSRTFLMEFRKTIRYAFLACLGATAVVALVGRFVLQIFGGAYADNGYIPLVLLSLGGMGLIVKDHHVALARVTGDVGHEALLVWALTVLEVACAVIGAVLGGLIGLSLGWLAAVALGALVYGPRVVRAYRRGVGVESHTSGVPPL